jgi:hypothetical protein
MPIPPSMDYEGTDTSMPCVEGKVARRMRFESSAWVVYRWLRLAGLRPMQPKPAEMLANACSGSADRQELTLPTFGVHAEAVLARY